MQKAARAVTIHKDMISYITRFSMVSYEHPMLLLDDMRHVIRFPQQNEARFAEHIGIKQFKMARLETTSEKGRCHNQVSAQTTALFKRLYADSVLGRIPNKQYHILFQEKALEQGEIQEQLFTGAESIAGVKDSCRKISGQI